MKLVIHWEELREREDTALKARQGEKSHNPQGTDGALVSRLGLCGSQALALATVARKQREGPARLWLCW